MKLVVGLGNPGARYAATRHNIGFDVLDHLSASTSSTPWREEFAGLSSWLTLAGGRVLALKPQTFMNDSGRSVAAAAALHGVRPEEILVVHDELDLPSGTLRLKQGGGDGGHRGLRSITAHLGADFARLRFGIGRPGPDFTGDIADFVLEAVAPEERAVLAESIVRASGVVVRVAEDGLSDAMNATNRRNR